MSRRPSITLEPATTQHGELLANLLELYIHDLSPVFSAVELADNGRFGYPKLSLYWSEPDKRFAFLIKSAERVAGFALVTRGSPVSPDPHAFDVAEFFVLRRYRRSRVGFDAASLLWRRFPGPWTVRVCEANQSALAFWDETIAAFSGDTAAEATQPGNPAPWRVFSFDSRAR